MLLIWIRAMRSLVVWFGMLNIRKKGITYQEMDQRTKRNVVTRCVRGRFAQRPRRKSE
jgi:hypothetical protein